MVKQCKICGKKFTTNYPQKKYCSKECKEEARRIFQRKNYKKNREKLLDYSKRYYWRVKKKCEMPEKCSKSYPCSYYTYIYHIPVELCLKCNKKICRFDDGGI